MVLSTPCSWPFHTVKHLLADLKLEQCRPLQQAAQRDISTYVILTEIQSFVTEEAIFPVHTYQGKSEKLPALASSRIGGLEYTPSGWTPYLGVLHSFCGLVGLSCVYQKANTALSLYGHCV